MSARVHRVLVEDLAAGELTLHGPEAHHLANVLRVRPGAAVEAFDGRGNVAGGAVVKAERQSVVLLLDAPAASAVEAPLRVSVAVALLKGDKLSDVVRQCTELGVANFQLLRTEHADAGSLSPARLQRLRRVAEEAAKQSGRATVPAVSEPLQLTELEWEGRLLVAHPHAGKALGKLWPGELPTGSVMVVTGPEGGLSEREVEQLAERGAEAVRFGPRILRAETAPVALAAALLLPGGE